MTNEPIDRQQWPYAGTSYWLESAGDDLTPRPSLDLTERVDVAILGGGFSGLWTAYYLAKRDPGLRIAIVERDIVGFGASGRNGGWCTTGFGAGPALLRHRYGVDVAVAVHDAMVDTILEIESVTAEEAIDAHFQRDGELVIARFDHHLRALDAVRRDAERIGRPNHWNSLDAAEASERLNVAGIRGAIYQPASAVIHPGRLVRGLARACERQGVTIYERTAGLDVVGGSPACLRTAAGDLQADVVVLAGESYLSQLPGRKRDVLPLYSLIVLTEPLTPGQLDAINWNHRSVVQSAALTVDYLSRTADGRILLGGRGAPYHFGSDIRPEHDRHDATHTRLRRTLVDWFPQLRGVRCTHAWGGTVGVPRDWMPTMRYDPASGIALAYGYTGEGVAAANLAGRILADLITETPSAISQLPMTSHRGRRWEPEPLRWLALRGAQRGALRADAHAERTGRIRPSVIRRLLEH